MAKKIDRLSALKVERTKKPGMYADGAGLWLRVLSGGAKSWIFRFMMNGRAREMGLGSANEVTLADARERAIECRRLRSRGIDPIENRRGERQAAALEAARAITFRECAEKYIASHKAAWRNKQHLRQWQNSLTKHVEPVIGGFSIQAIDTALVMRVLEPMWTAKTETASRLRQRIEVILDWAKVQGFRDGENPARWRGHFDKLVAKPSKVKKITHFSALPYSELPAFMRDLRNEKGTVALALEFTILTVARSSEVIGARWDEINFATKTWTIPGDRTKAGREHRKPLSARAVAILEKMTALRDQRHGDFVFPGNRAGRPFSHGVLLPVLQQVGRAGVTVHGFRSTFRDWVAERTNYPREVAEMALGHSVGDATERAYMRTDLFEKRRRLMDEWALYCEFTHSGHVVISMRRNRGASQ